MNVSFKNIQRYNNLTDPKLLNSSVRAIVVLVSNLSAKFLSTKSKTWQTFANLATSPSPKALTVS